MQRIKLSDVVSNWLVMTNLGDAEYTRAYLIALRGARQFKLDSDGDIQRVTLMIKGDGTADLPEDCVKPMRLIRNGSCGCSNSRPLTSSDLSTHCGLKTGMWMNAGEYDIRGNVVYFKNRCSCGSVDLEYLALDSDGDEHFINPIFEEALIAFINYQWFLTKKNNSGWDKQYYKKIYDDAIREARFRFKSPTKDKLRQSAYNTNKIG